MQRDTNGLNMGQPRPEIDPTKTTASLVRDHARRFDAALVERALEQGNPMVCSALGAWLLVALLAPEGTPRWRTNYCHYRMHVPVPTHA